MKYDLSRFYEAHQVFYGDALDEIRGGRKRTHWMWFGRPDDEKLQSCMTLFACASGGEQVFLDVLQQYFDGQQDERTLKLLGQPRQ